MIALTRKLWIFTVLLAALVMTGCVSLAGDVTPPPNYVRPTDSDAPGAAAAQPGAQAVSQTVYPLVPPDPAQGAQIYGQKCAACHGDSGKGDGAQSANLPNPPAPIGQPDFAHMARPADWFSIVTNGNLQRYMPGFSESLNERQRWDVVAYAMTLSISQEELTQGKTLYDANCAACHGSAGKGDGTQAASLKTKPTSWIDQSKLVSLSADDIVQVLMNGQGEMPAYKGKLDETQSYAVASYIRTLSFSGSMAPAVAQAAAGTPAAGDGTPSSADAAATAHAGVGTVAPGTTPAAGTPSSSDAAATAHAGAGTIAPNTTPSGAPVTITGQVTNGTPGGKVPEGMKVTLLAFNGMSPAFDQAADVSADGSYKFTDVQRDTNYVYIIQSQANGLTFNSDILHASDIQGDQAELPLKIYETTTDTSSLKADRLHVFFDFTTAGKVQVVNLFVVTNTSDRTVIPTEKTKPVINFDLPKGAENLQFQDGALGDRFVQTENGFGDTASVVPGQGQHQVLFAYDLPYENKLDLTVKTPLTTDAVIVMVPPGVELKGDKLVSQGQRDVQGMSFQMYQGLGSLPAGGTLDMEVSGKAGDAASAASGLNQTTYLLIGLGVFGLVLIGAGAWLYYSRRRQPALAAAGAMAAGDGMTSPDGETSEMLLDAILAVDDQHASGELGEAAYQERRAELKARLANALEREKGK